LIVTVAIGDTHIPYEEPEMIKCALAIIKAIEPTNVFLIGDIIDFYPVSRYAKDPRRINSLQDEVDKVYEFQSEVRKAAPKSNIVYFEGNHEERFEKFLITRAPELYNLRMMEISELLRVKEFGIEYCDNLKKVGDTAFTHGHIIRKHSGYTARAMAEEYGTVLFGHTHRMGIYHRRDGRGNVVAIENGCLCKLDPEYLKGIANWQHGFTVVTHDDGQSSYEQVQFTDRKAIFRGKRWK